LQRLAEKVEVERRSEAAEHEQVGEEIDRGKGEGG
jgi:hypothetical protein